MTEIMINANPGEHNDDGGIASFVPNAPVAEAPVEVGGRKGPDPTRYGDWEKNGRCIDF